MIKTKIAIAVAVSLLSALPLSALALQMPQSGNELATYASISAQAYIVSNADTGQVLVDKNADLAWTPASLTKLITALVVLDTKPNLSKSVAITAHDQALGACGAGGDCIKAKTGVKFTVDGLFHAALLPSANNAAAALADSTGMTQKQFAAKMNAKAKALGAASSHFNEPTGMDPANTITAGDYAKIVAAAYANSYLKSVAQTSTFLLKSTNNAAYNQTIKNSDKLLAADGIQMIGAKTGYLDESQYNFASLLKYQNGPRLSIVLLGEPHLYLAFSDTQILAQIAGQIQNINPIAVSSVSGEQ